MTPKEYAASLRIHIEHATGGLPTMDAARSAAFWRIVEFQAALMFDAAQAHYARICEDVGRDGGTAFDAAQAVRESG
jgi:hypothetical protein